MLCLATDLGCSSALPMHCTKSRGVPELFSGASGVVCLSFHKLDIFICQNIECEKNDKCVFIAGRLHDYTE